MKKENKKQEPVINHKHTFKAGKDIIQLNINSLGGWRCDIIDGYTGTATLKGGQFKTLKDYIKYVEDIHKGTHGKLKKA